MIEKHFQTPEDIVLLERWMNAAPNNRPEVPAFLADKLERLQRAYRWLLTHHSKTKVWQMMHAYYTGMGRKYSEMTARTDVNEAERLFITISPFTVPFTAELMFQSLYERYHAAVRQGNDDAAAKYSNQLDKWADRLERLVRERQEAVHEPIPIRAVFDLKEAGIEPIPDLKARIDAWQRTREERKNPPPPSTDAEFTEVPDGT
jgi:hypothetical protein